MQSAVPYREAQPAPGLPFPRRNLVAWTLVVILLALGAFILPLLMLGGTNLNSIWTNFKNGGMGMYLLLLMGFALPIALTVLAILGIRGRNIPSSITFAVASLPVFVGVLFDWRGLSTTVGAISGESVDSAQKLRILLEGIAESDCAQNFGCSIGALLLGIVAAQAAGTAATVDRDRLAKPLGSLWIASLGASALLVIVPIALAVVLREIGFIVFSLPATLMIGFLATSSARNAGTFEGWHDAKEASSAASSITVAAVASALGLFLVDHAQALWSTSRALSAVAMQSYDLSQRARILAEWLHESSGMTAIAVVHAVLTIAAFSPAILRAKGARPFGISAIVAVGIALAVMGGTAGMTSHSTSFTTKLADLRPQLPASLALPQLEDIAELRSSGDAPTMIHADGTHDPIPSAERDMYRSDPGLAIAIDRRATAAAVFKAMFPRDGTNSSRELRVYVTSNEPHSAIPPELAPYLGEENRVVSITLETPAPKRFLPLAAFLDDHTIVIQTPTATEKIDVSSGYAARAEKVRESLLNPNDNVTLYVRDSTTAENLARAAAILRFDNGSVTVARVDASLDAALKDVH